MDNTVPRFTVTSGQLETIKILAVLFMVSDHINAIIFRYDLLPLSLIGRMAFPLFCFVAAYNYQYHTKNIRLYMKWLLSFAVLSQPVYDWALHTGRLNIFFTIALGIGLIAAYDRWPKWRQEFSWIKRMAILTFSPILLLILSFYLDYYLSGIILIPAMVLWLRYRSDLMLFAVMVATMASNGFQYFAICALLSYVCIIAVIVADWNWPRLPRITYYAFYPIHLAALKLIALYVVP